MTADNHYTPCVYLKGFTGADRRLFVYRTLVPSSRVPLWKPSSAKSIGYHRHLYTRVAVGQQTDEIERWFKTDFEDPAAGPLERVLSDSKLTTKDWHHLVRFLAAQIVRTPAYFVKNLPRWQENTPVLLNSILSDLEQTVEAARRTSQPVMPRGAPFGEYIPIRVNVEPEPAREVAAVKAAILVGRGMWQFAMRHLLGDIGAAKILHDYRWSILAPHEGLMWHTSDDPVVCLNYYADGTYNFGAGWGTPGACILFPVSPKHLLYTRIGQRIPCRATASFDETQRVRHIIARHAHRMIFAQLPEEDIPALRPRIVDQKRFQEEEQQWTRWHDEQTTAEERLKDHT